MVSMEAAFTAMLVVCNCGAGASTGVEAAATCMGLVYSTVLASAVAGLEMASSAGFAVVTGVSGNSEEAREAGLTAGAFAITGCGSATAMLIGFCAPISCVAVACGCSTTSAACVGMGVSAGIGAAMVCTKALFPMMPFACSCGVGVSIGVEAAATCMGFSALAVFALAATGIEAVCSTGFAVAVAIDAVVESRA